VRVRKWSKAFSQTACSNLLASGPEQTTIPKSSSTQGTLSRQLADHILQDTAIAEIGQFDFSVTTELGIERFVVGLKMSDFNWGFISKCFWKSGICVSEAKYSFLIKIVPRISGTRKRMTN
jgi:hypothetical protein